MSNLREAEGLEPIPPPCAVRLVENAAAYARDIGFSPHEEYTFTKKIFGDIDPASCSREFPFGKDGKPFYISGPNETSADPERIIGILNKKLGPEGFHYLTRMELPEE
jgi:hypothetical protein